MRTALQCEPLRAFRVTEDPPSTLPFILRRSFQLSAFQVLMLGVGAWLVIGVFTGFDALAGMAGNQTWLAYLLFTLLLMPTVLSHIELRQGIRRTGGSYRLLQSLERPVVTYLAGWTVLIGWAGLSGAVAWSFAGQVSRVVAALTPMRLERLPLALGFVAIFGLLSATGRRPAWTLGIRFAALAGLALLAQVIVLARNRPVVVQVGPELDLFAAVAALGAAAWVLELLAERQPRGQVLQATLPGWLLGPALAALLAFVGSRTLARGMHLEAIGELAFPGIGGVASLSVGATATLLLWYPLSLIMLRQLQTIGSDGVLPDWLRRPSPKRGHPTRLSVLQAVLTALAVGLASVQGADQMQVLLNLGAASFLTLHLGVNVASMLLGNQIRASPGRLHLPLFPLVPATGAAINFLLILVLPNWSRAAILIWLALGLLAFWQGGRARMTAAQLGVTVFQQRPDVRSQYPVMIPVANPETASALVALGGMIARDRGGHLLLLQVIKVADHLPLDSGRQQARHQLDLMKRLLGEAEALGVQVEAITRLSRSVPQGILDSVAEESAKMVIMGSPVRPQLGSSGFGPIVDGVLEGAACEVGVLIGDGTESPRRVVVPVSTEVEGEEAARLALAMTEPAGGQVSLIHIVQPGQPTRTGEQLLSKVAARVNGGDRLEGRVFEAGSALDGILKACSEADLVILGAADQGLLDEEQFGRLPIQVAMRLEAPMLLIRSQATLPAFVARRAWRSFADLFPTLNREEQMAIFRRMREAVRPNVNYFVLITLSAVIATLGLLLNSPAVVIGAMLVAPLMTPLVGAAVGIAFGDTQTLRNGIAATLQGMLAAIFIAILVTALVPAADVSGEVLARTQPTLIDLFVALASGMAGAYAIARKEVGEALPGVAIAAALLPPLASIGIGLALGQASIAGGALLLFTTNLVAIIFASALVFLLLGIRPPRVKERELRLRQGLVISVLTLLLVSIPLGYFLWRTVERDAAEGRAREIVEQTAQRWQAVRVVDLEIRAGNDQMVVSGIVYSPTQIERAQIADLKRELEAAVGRRVELELFGVAGSDLLLPGE